MRRLNQWMLAAILTICGTMTMGLTSCSDVDNPVTNTGITEADMKQASIGLHLDLTDVVLGTDRVRIWDLKDNNKFVAYDLYTDDEENFAVEQLSGTWKPFVKQTLDWDIDETIQASGITVVYDDEAGQPGNADIYETFFGFNIPDENNKVENDDLFFLAEEALAYLAYTESVSENPELYEGADSLLLSRSAASPDDFAPTENETVQLLGSVSNNVTLTQQALSTKQAQQLLHQTVMNILTNETKGIVNKNPNDAAFNSKTWRDQTTIQLWDGQKHITVQLPWSLEVTNNNLPMNFCDDIKPANGWDLVMNYCGEPLQTIGSSGYHFFALYNKYSGILRFFTYIPENFNANNANDHAWEVTMGEQTAQHLEFRYGLPMDKRIANRSALGMNSSDYNVYCTPWVASRSQDGFVTPNPGWWAFDVDLSNYRPGYTAALERIRLQMRAWANSSVSLNSVLSAKILQEGYSTAYNCNSLNGVVSMLGDVSGTVGSLVKGITDAKWGDAVKAGFGLLGKGYNVFTSIRDKDTAKPKYNVVNTIEGTIDTKGLISGTVNVARVTSPDMPMTRFDTENTTLGQGVWNIKSSPVVYQLDAQFSFKTRVEDGSLVTAYFEVIDGKSRDKFSASPCVFDPSSVEVVLNPNVFPNEDIEYVDVKTFCAVRNKTKHDMGSEYRKAFGLSVYNEYTLSKDQIYMTDYKMDSNNPAWDFLYGSNDKMGLTYPKVYKDIETDNKVGYALIGRGDDNALLEPIMFGYDDSTWGQDIKPYLPFYEVTVQLNVKLKSLKTPLTYTRVYLPEVRWLDFSKAKGVVTHAEEWLANLKKSSAANSPNGTSYQDYQLNHMKSVLSFIKPGYDSSMEGVTFTQVSARGDNISKMFDGNLNTAWEPSIRARENGSYWECEFKASRPINLKSYTLYNHSNWNKYQSEPTLWALSAKNAKGEWIQVDWRNNEQPGGNSASKTYQVTPGTYQEFKLKVVNYNGSLSGWKAFWGADLRLRIAEMIFHE